MTTAKKNSSEILQHLQSKLSGIVPDFELKLKAELAYEINLLKEELNAVILGHNYMEPALFHSIPDFVGDSLELSRRAAETDKDVIVFCGVFLRYGFSTSYEGRSNQLRLRYKLNRRGDQ